MLEELANFNASAAADTVVGLAQEHFDPLTALAVTSVAVLGTTLLTLHCCRQKKIAKDIDPTSQLAQQHSQKGADSTDGLGERSTATGASISSSIAERVAANARGMRGQKPK